MSDCLTLGTISQSQIRVVVEKSPDLGTNSRKLTKVSIRISFSEVYPVKGSITTAAKSRNGRFVFSVPRNGRPPSLEMKSGVVLENGGAAGASSPELKKSLDQVSIGQASGRSPAVNVTWQFLNSDFTK